MRVFRSTARVVAWVFVAFIAYHVGLAAVRAVRAGRDGNWGYAVELGAIALVGAVIVIAAVAGAVRGRSRTPGSRKP